MEKPSSKSSARVGYRKKPKLKKVLLGVSATGFAFLVGWIAWKKLSQKEKVNYEPIPDDNQPALPPANSGNTSSYTYRPDTTFPLTIYTKGEKVKLIQKALNARFKSGLKVDGFWGPATQAALSQNGQPTSISGAQYQVLLNAMKQLGLNGPANSTQFAATLRSCTGTFDNGHNITLNSGTLVGMVAGQTPSYADILTNSGRIIRLSREDITIS